MTITYREMIFAHFNRTAAFAIKEADECPTDAARRAEVIE
jgi:hypothetical protein